MNQHEEVPENMDSDEEVSFWQDNIRDPRSPGSSPHETGHGDAALVFDKNRRQLILESYSGESSWEEYIKVF